jgi:hypothetical protein
MTNLDHPTLEVILVIKGKQIPNFICPIVVTGISEEVGKLSVNASFD